MAEAMVLEMNQKHGRRVSGLTDEILDRMLGYSWPGNARELRNTIERAVILCPDGAPLDVSHLPRTFGATQAAAAAHAGDIGVVPIRVGTTVDEARTAADSKNPGVDRTKQDACGRDPGSEPEDTAQQAKGIQPLARRSILLRPIVQSFKLRLAR